MATFLQVWIALTGVSAIIVMIFAPPKRRLLGCVIGLLGQPAWLYSSFQHFQWGIFALTICYTAIYLQGIYAHWPRRNPQ